MEGLRIVFDREKLVLGWTEASCKCSGWYAIDLPIKLMTMEGDVDFLPGQVKKIYRRRDLWLWMGGDALG